MLVVPVFKPPRALTLHAKAGLLPLGVALQEQASVSCEKLGALQRRISCLPR